MITYAGILMFMEKLKQLINCNDNPLINIPSFIYARPQFQLLYEELGSMIQTLFKDEHLDVQELQKVNYLKKRFVYEAEKAQYIVDLFLSGVHIRNNGHFPTSADFKRSLDLDDVWSSLKSIMVEFMSIRIDSMNMDSSLRPETSLLSQSAAASSISFTRNPQRSKKLLEEIVVGLDRDAELIRENLVKDQKKVDVVSIVGMGGIGKTTLATKVFNDRFVVHHFDVRAWVTVSQTYNKRDVLIQILESIRDQLDLEKANDSQLREMVHKHLTGKRYLIVFDDIWHIKTWDNLKLFFPHDNNGSRILLTSRLIEVAKHANSNGLIHHLGYLSKERSWELLCQKVFHGDKCPEWLIKPGMQIVENCQGLPLAVVIIAGVLAKESLSEKFWVEIAYRTGSYIVGDLNGSIMETLALSYNHLPLHLRDCFLYLGVFPEDYMFQVRWLSWLLIAEGFIQQAGDRSLEDIAEGYLLDLIDRNLVILTNKWRSNGGVKAFKLHDLVRELCLRKAKEEGFILQTERQTSSSQFSNVTTPPVFRMSINKDTNILAFPYPSSQNLRSILCFNDFTILSDFVAYYFRSFVLLRVLDLQQCSFEIFPKGMELLVHLRYLAIWISTPGFSSSICNLWSLQTLIYISDCDTTLPNNISDLINLRHLWSYSPSAHGYKTVPTKSTFHLPSIDKPMNLRTFKNVRLGVKVDIQKCFPYIKELRCMSDEENDFKPLTYLENLFLLSQGMEHITLPATLKVLTLEGCRLPWSEMSIIQSLPNLQVLKLLEDAFVGSCWNTDEQEFRQLQFLRLDGLNIKQWEAYSTSFPCLKKLVVFMCEGLEKIPLEIGEIPTLELIEISLCRPSACDSVRRIQKEQHEFGNYDLKVNVELEDAPKSLLFLKQKLKIVRGTKLFTYKPRNFRVVDKQFVDRELSVGNSFMFV